MKRVMSTPTNNSVSQKAQDPATASAEKTGIVRLRDRERTREKLQFAMLRVKNKGKKLSISSVAEEAGVTPGLIHNTYPHIAEAIRAEVGKGTRKQRDEKAADLLKTLERNKELRAELSAALVDLQMLASINETLRQELAILRSAQAGKVTMLPSRV